MHRRPFSGVNRQQGCTPLGLQAIRAGPGKTAAPRLTVVPGLVRTVTTTKTVDHDTIYALSTAPGRAAIAVIRVSGSRCLDVYRALCRDDKVPRARFALLRRVYRPGQTQTHGRGQGDELEELDSGALVLYFPAPRTVTGEDVLEFQVHGGAAIVKAVLEAIQSVGEPGGEIRYAEPGEFTLRAFQNARLDLPQIEALGETLTADTEQQRRLAVRGTGAALTTRYEQWRVALLYARGELEALIDFAEDQHFDESAEEFVRSVGGQIQALRRQIALHVDNAARGELRRSGIRIALLGAPNAGKSSLLNLVVGRQAAIVSTEEGTTRDIVDVGVDLGGWFCKIGDMAGVRSKLAGAVEREGIRRARERALESDVVVVVVSLDEVHRTLQIEQEVIEATNDCIKTGKRILIAVNKCDLLPSVSIPRELLDSLHSIFPSIPENRIIGISCRAESNAVVTTTTTTDPLSQPQDGNIQALLHGLIATFQDLSSPTGISTDHNGVYDTSYWEDSLGVTHRQRANLETCLHDLDQYLLQTSLTQDHDAGEIDVVTAAENLRAAADALAKITGRGESGDVEDVLGVVFEKYVSLLTFSFRLDWLTGYRFCVGK